MAVEFLVFLTLLYVDFYSQILMNVACIPTEVRFVPGNALIYQDPIGVLVQMDGGHWPMEDHVKVYCLSNLQRSHLCKLEKKDYDGS